MSERCRSLSVLLLLIVGTCLFSSIPAYSNEYCAFCEPDVLDRQTFYEDELVLALYTHKPILPGHCLVIPKRHVERFEMLTEAEMVQIANVLKKVDQAVMQTFATSSYLLLQKNGVEVGQTVPHVHFHYVPRKTGDNSTIGFLVKMYLSNVKYPIAQEEMQETVERLKEAMK